MDAEKLEKIKEFLEPHKMYYCALYEKVLAEEKNIFVIEDSAENICGIFSYSKGESFCGCFNFCEQIEFFLKNFFTMHNVFCITGKLNDVKLIEKCLLSVQKKSDMDRREMFLMKYSKKEFIPDYRIYRITQDNISEVLPLQTGFTQEEVVPYWKDYVAYAERYKLQKLITHENIWGIRKEGRFASKINTISSCPQTVILGGVYTEKEFRSQGMASNLVWYAADFFDRQNKDVYLYVKKENSPAIKAYKKAGFEEAGEFGIFYYKN